MEKLYSVLIDVDGAHVVEYNVVQETSGTYHIHGVNGKRVIKKDSIGSFERVGDNSYRTICFEVDVEGNIQVGVRKLIDCLETRLNITYAQLKQVRSDHSHRTFTSVDLDGQDHTLDFQEKFNK